MPTHLRVRSALLLASLLLVASSTAAAQAPLAPTMLYVGNDEAQTGGAGDPVVDVNHKPVFSAVFNHEDPDAAATEARVQIASDAEFTAVVATTAWRATAGTPGQRISDVEYKGNKLECGVRYWWRISIRDGASVASPWSGEAASFTTVLCPGEPTALYVGSYTAQNGEQGDPVAAISLKPFLSATATHEDPAGALVDAKVQFATDAEFANRIATTSWQAIAPTIAGSRSPDIQYSGSALPPETRVWWRIKFRDSAGTIGPWSTEAASFVTLSLPAPPTQLFVGNEDAQTGSKGDPVPAINLKPSFSALYQHAIPGETASKVRVQIASDAAFTSVVVTTSWKDALATPAGGRCPDVSYNGNALQCGSRYWWRVAFQDSFGNIGEWSTEPASFETVFCPHSPVQLQVGSIEAQTGTSGDPVQNIILKPYFSAVSAHASPNALVTDAKLQFALDADFTQLIATTGWKAVNPAISGERCSDIKYTGNAFDGYTRIWWRIRFRDDAGTVGPWSEEAASFVTTPTPLPPTGLFVDAFDAQAGSMGNPVHFVDQTPHFSVVAHHQDTQALITALKVQIAVDPEFLGVVWTSAWKSIPATTDGFRTEDVEYTGSALAANTTYYWRVRSRDATDQLSDWSTEAASFVTDHNSPPNLAPVGEATLTEGTPFTLTLQGSDPDPYTVLTYSASGLPAGASLNSSTGELSWTPGFSQAGQYPVVFRVSDNNPFNPMFDEETGVFTVVDANGPPTITTASGDTQFSMAENSNLAIPLEVADPDLSDGLSVQATLAGGLPLPDGARTVLSADGYRFEWDTNFEQAGTYQIVLTVTDNGTPPLATSLDITIEVQNVNRPPVMDAVAPVSAAEGQDTAIQLRAVDPDAEDTLIYSASTPLPEGAVLVPETGLLAWTPTFEQAGHYEFTVSVTDTGSPALGDSRLVVINVANTNRAPVIDHVGNYLIYEGAELVVSITVSDPDSEDLVSVAITMADGLPLPAGAGFVDGVLIWTPSFQQAGTYGLKIRAEDNHLPPETAEQLFSVTVVNVNRAPAFLNAANQSLNEGTPFSLQLQVADPDTWDSHVFSLEPGEGASLPAGLVLDTSTGLLSWTPTYAQAGSWPIRLTVTDSGEPPLSASESITLIVADVPHEVTMVGHFPEVNANGVAPTAVVDAAFSEPMAVPQSGQFTVSSNWRGTVPGAVTLDGNSIQFHPGGSYFAGELVGVSASSNLLSSLEASLSQPFMWQFRVSTATSEAGFSRQVAPFGSDSSEVRDVVVADFDNDGDLDFLVLATSPAAANYMYRNDGSGNMAAASIIGTGASGPAGIRALDYNGDGATDVLYWIGSVGYIYVNAGGMQFNLAGSVNLQPGLAEVEVGDMNADGRADLVTVTESGLVTVMERASEGFVEAGTLDLGAGLLGTYRIELADIYANGGLEIVVANEALVQVLTHSSLTVAQAFPHPAGALKDLDVADTNGDRYPDIYVTGESLWAFVADPNTGFGAGSFIDLNGTPVQDVDLGDVDGDGDLDMLVAFADYTLVMRNLGNGQLFDAHEAVGNAIGGEPSQLMRTFAVDMNGDRKLDVINLRAEGYGRTFFNTDRLRASIHDAEGVAPYTGERVVQVPVTLDFTPVNAVTVYYETVDEPPPPSGGDHDALPNPNDFTLAAAAPPGGAGYIPTSGLLTFQPGVRTQWISVTLTATAPVSGVLHISVRLTQVLGVPGLIQPGGALVLVQTGTISVAQPGALPSVPPQPAMSTDWRVEGPVNAITNSGQVSYLGGDFRAVSWARNQAASFDVVTGLPGSHFPSGVHGSFTGPGGTGQPSIITAADDGAWVIVGGSFQYSEAGGGTYLSIVRLNKATGMADPKFNPSPMDGSSAGCVNAIVVQGVLVSYGGHFNSARSSPSSGWTTRSNLDRVQWNSSSGDYEGLPTGYIGQPSAANPEVFALLAEGSKLLVGGEFGQAADAAGANAKTVFNIALFDHTSTTATLAYNSSFVGVTLSGNHLSPDGSVRAFASNGSEIVVGGEFRYYGAHTASPIPQYTWADLQAGGSNRDNLLQINGLVSFGSPVPLPFVGVGAVRSLQFYNSGTGTHPYHLFVGQVGSQSAPTVPSLLRGAWDGSGSLQNMGTALAVVDQLAISGTTLLAGTRGTAADFWATPSVRRYQLAAGPYVATLDALPNTGNAPLGALAVDGSGIALAFGGFTRFGVGRSNLAAFESTQGTLLDWRPRPTGPVYAVETTGQDVFFGGAFGTVNDFTGLGNLSASPVYGTAAPDTIRNWSGAYIRAGGPVYALAYDAGRQLIYVGGEFGTLNNDVRTSLGVINTLTGGVKNFWDPVVIKDLNGTFQPGRVNALALNADTIYVGGSFDYVNGDMRTDLAAVTAWDAANQADSHTSWAPPVVGGANRTVKALKIDAGAGRVYVGGDFARVSGFDRASFAALSLTNGLHVDHWNVGGGAAGSVNAIALAPNGDLFVGGEFNAFGGVANVSGLVRADRLTGVGDPLWVPSLLPAPNGLGGTSTSVRAIALDNQTATPVLRFAGVFEESSASPSALYLASLEQPLVIAPVQLLNATEGQSYQVQFNLSLGTTASWSIGAGATASLAPYLKLDPNTGLLVSIDPVSQLTAPLPLGIVPPGQVGHFALSITASVSGTLVSRQYTLTVTPAPTTSFVPNQAGSFPNRSVFTENDAPVQFIAGAIELALSSPSPMSPVTVDLEVIPQSTYPGGGFTLSSSQAVFAAGATSASIDLSIFGDDQPRLSPRKYLLRLKSVTSGMATIGPIMELEVWILEDDLPVRADAVASDLLILENVYTISDQQHVLSNNPLASWTFFADNPLASQALFRAEVYEDNGLLSLVWDSGWILSNAEQVPLAQGGAGISSLLDGRRYWLKVTLEDSFGLRGTGTVHEFRCNTPPSPVDTLSHIPSDNAFISDATPTLTFEAPYDAEGDPLSFWVNILDDQTSLSHGSISSQGSGSHFEYSVNGGLDWLPFPMSGLASSPGALVRVVIPSNLALTNNISYRWSVTCSDGFEVTPSLADTKLTLSASYRFNVSLFDSSMLPDSLARSAYVMRLSTGVTYGPVTITGGTGTITMPVALEFAEPLVFYLDTGGGQTTAASTVRLFGGSDAILPNGPNGVISLVHGHLILDSRLDTPMTLAALDGVAYGSSLPTDIGWYHPTASEASLAAWVQSVQLDGTFVLSTPSSTPLTKWSFLNSFGPTTCVGQSAEVLVAGAAALESHVLANQGSLSLDQGASLRISASSTTQGHLGITNGAYLFLDGQTLWVDSGTFSAAVGIVSSSAGTGTLHFAGGEVLVSGLESTNCRLVVGNGTNIITFDTVSFTGTTGGLGTAWIRWESSTPGGSRTIHNVAFHSAPVTGSYNVSAASTADVLIFVGSTGPGSGELFDEDPDELLGGNRVSWEFSRVTDLEALPGDHIVFLHWSANSQVGGNIHYLLYMDTSVLFSTKTLIAATQETTFIHSGLSNHQVQYYYVTLGEYTGGVWVEHGDAQSDPASATPIPSTLTSVTPAAVYNSGRFALTLTATGTHWDSGVVFTCSDTAITVDNNSVVLLSPSLALVEIDVTSATPGATPALTANVPNLWAQYGAQGLSESVSHLFTITQRIGDNAPLIAFTNANSGVEEGESTSGAFNLVVEYDAAGGAPVNLLSLEIVTNRDIQVSGITIVAGQPMPGVLSAATNLASSAYQIFSVTASGAEALIDQASFTQLASTPTTGVERFEQGRYVISARIANSRGIFSEWTERTIYVDGHAHDQAQAEGELHQGENTTLYLRGTDLLGCDTVVFPAQSGVTVNASPPISDAGTIQSIAVTTTMYRIAVPVSVSQNAEIGEWVCQIYRTGTFVANARVDVLSLPRNWELNLPALANQSSPLAARDGTNVAVYNGEFQWTATDMMIKGRTLPIVWNRSYRNDVRLATPDATLPMGRNWFGIYFQKLWFYKTSSVDPGVMYWLSPDGSVVKFEYNSQYDQYWPSKPGISAIADYTPGTRLVRITTDRNLHYVFRTDPSDDDPFSMELWTVGDEWGNVITLEYEAGRKRRVTRIYGDVYSHTRFSAEEMGEYLELHYDNTNLLHEVVHMSKDKYSSPQIIKKLVYFYDSDRQLTGVQQPDTEQSYTQGVSVSGYAYDAEHRLSKMYNPNETELESDGVLAGRVRVKSTASPLLEIVYIHSATTAVRRQIQGTVKTEFLYGAFASDGSREVKVYDGKGTETHYKLNVNGQVLWKERSGKRTSYLYDDLARVSEVIAPKGNITRYTYLLGDIVGSHAGYTVTGMSENSVARTTRIYISSATSGNAFYLGMSYQGVPLNYWPILLNGGAFFDVPGQLVHEGWWNGSAGAPPGLKLFLFGYGFPNPLNGNSPSQIQMIPWGTSTPSQVRTTTVVVELETVGGKERVGVPTTTDEFGMETRTYKVSENEDFIEPESADSFSTTQQTVRSGNAFRLDNSSYVETLTTTVVFDAFGRVKSMESDKSHDLTHTGLKSTGSRGYSPTKTTTYHYMDGSSLGTVVGKLEHEDTLYGMSPSDVYSTSFGYDARGDVSWILPPEAANPAPGFSSDDYKTLFETNARGQVWKIESPVPAPGAERPTTLRFHDRNGALVHEASSFTAGGATWTGSLASGSIPSNIASIPPGSLRAAGLNIPANPEEPGWFHTEFEYDRWGKLRSVSKDNIALDPSSSSNWNTVSEREEYEYDANGNVVSQRTPGGLLIRYEYDEFDRIQKVIKPTILFTGGGHSGVSVGGLAFVYEYDDNGNRVKDKERLADQGANAWRETVYEYDGFDRVIRTTYPAGASGTALVEETHHAGRGDRFDKSALIAGTSDKTRISTVHYDGLGRPWASTRSAADLASVPGHPWGGSAGKPGFNREAAEFTEYGPNNAVLRTVDASGAKTLHQSDGLGRPVLAVAAGSFDTTVARVETTQGTAERIDKEIVPQENGAAAYQAETRSTLDTLGRVVESTDPDGVVTQFTYDGQGSIARMKVVGGSTSEYAYDANGRVVEQRSIISTGNRIERTAYDSDGRVVKEWAYDGSAWSDTSYEYDERGRLSLKTMPDKGTEEYSYDLADRLITIRMTNGVVVTNIYSNRDELTQRTIDTHAAPSVGGANKEIYGYNGFGEVTSAKTFKKVGQADKPLTEQVFEYNNLGLVKRFSQKSFTPEGKEIKARFTGHLFTDDELGFSSLYDYDQNTSHEVVVGEWSVTNDYRIDGALDTRTFWDKRKIHFIYDTRGRLTQATDTADSATISLFENSYQGWGRLVKRRYCQNGPARKDNVLTTWRSLRASTSAFSYTAAGRVRQVQHQQTPGTLPAAGIPAFATVSHQFDGAGRVQSEWRSHHANFGRVFSYDDDGRLTNLWAGVPVSVSYGGSAIVPDPTSDIQAYAWHRSYGFDAVGNRTQVTESLRAPSPTAGNPVNEQLTYHKDAEGNQTYTSVDSSLHGQGHDFSYTGKEEVSSDPTTDLTYIYDYTGKVVEVRDFGTTIRRVIYDAFGRKTVEVNGTNENNRLVHLTIHAPEGPGGSTGAKPIAEVTLFDYNPMNDAAPMNGQDLVQYTYGLGCAGNTVVERRLVEFVAYRLGDSKPPYYRFLNEDQLGSLVSSTDEVADRVEEFDYLDYGAPVRRPVKFDGDTTKISNVGPYQSLFDITLIQLSAPFLKTMELAGCEVQALKPGAGAWSDRIASANVMTCDEDSIIVDDPGGKFRAALQSSMAFAYYDMPQGFISGLLDDDTRQDLWDHDNNISTAAISVTVLTNNHEAWSAIEISAGSQIRIGGQAYNILGRGNIAGLAKVDELYLDPNLSFSENTRWEAEQAFTVDHPNGTLSGIVKGVGVTGNQTVLTLHELSTLHDGLLNWLIQPDVREPAYFTIESINYSQNSITLHGDAGSVVSVGSHFAIFTPPGIDAGYYSFGTMSSQPRGQGSNCLWASYTYVAPLTGFLEGGSPVWGQAGWNALGDYNVWNRWYSPWLGRFTTPDPARSPSWNLQGYALNDPVNMWDPEGLSVASWFFKTFFPDSTRGLSDTDIDLFVQDFGRGVQEGINNAVAGATYGALNALTLGFYRDLQSPEEFARYFGADANSCAFQAAAIVTEFVGSVALAAATGGSSALARSGVMGARLAMGARSAMLAADVVQAARGVVKYQESGDVTDLAGAAALVGGHAVGRLVGRGSQTGRAAELIEEGCTSRTCFVAGTQVLALSTGSGQAADETGSNTATNIEDIEVGDWVWSRNEETGEEGLKPVTRLFRNEADTLVHLTYTTGSAGASAAHTGTHTLTGTEEHPFWSVTRNAWVPMGELQAGETLLLGGPAVSPSKGGQTATAASVRIEHLATPVAVYNFEVADWHTYHVGAADTGWVYVHNLCKVGQALEDLGVNKLKAMARENRAMGLVQDHHLIPYGGKANFQGHGLVQAANVNLETYARNIRALGNHRGGHTRAYRREVRRILDAQLDLFKQGGGSNAQRYLDDAISQIEQGIRNRSLRPYTNQDVWFPR